MDIDTSENQKKSVFSSILYWLFPALKSKQSKVWISSSSLILMNLFILFGLLFLGWEPWLLLIVYWAESAIIGFFNILKMLISGMFNREKKFSLPLFLLGIFFSAFFVVHYCGFMLAHGIFLLILLLGGFGMISPVVENGAEMAVFEEMVVKGDKLLSSFMNISFASIGDFFSSELFALLVLFISHAISFYLYFIRDKEFFSKQPMDYFIKPYGRIIVMHLTLILGAIVLVLTNWQNIFLIILWVLLKIIIDQRSHFKTHHKKSGIRQSVN